MIHEADGTDDHVQRKQSRPTRARGKAGYRRLEAILEAANIVVQRVETENDIGRDAFVDLVEGTDVSGGVICVQVKSGQSFLHKGQWVVPGKAADLTLWRESTVPFFGVVHDPEDDALRWVDLSQAATLAVDAHLSPVIPGPYGKPSVPVPAENRLDVDLAPFLAAAQTSLRRRSGSPAAALLADDAETVEVGIVDTFAVGRNDPAAFLLLAALFHRLPKACRRLAVITLAMTTPHPDVLWTKQNWIPAHVSSTVRKRCRWTASDIAALLCEIDENGVERGSIGQTVFYVLALDQDLQTKLFRTALDRVLPDSVRFWAAAIRLYLAGESAPEVLDKLFESDRTNGNEEALFSVSHRLEEVEHFEYLAQSIADLGYVSLF
ncbi:MAG: DUF4365 domain-containing protein [Actinomycetota bacterium]|nr:DUF4365 domain-containing protein [Actinomycetota bacterium]